MRQSSRVTGMYNWLLLLASLGLLLCLSWRVARHVGTLDHHLRQEGALHSGLNGGGGDISS